MAAITEAAGKFLHISSDYWHETQVRLGEKMNEIAPMGEPVLSFFAQSGTESVEGALKLARSTAPAWRAMVSTTPRSTGARFHGTVAAVSATTWCSAVLSVTGSYSVPLAA